MLISEYKLDGSSAQYAAIDGAIRVVQFIRNTCLRLWMDERGISKNDLQCSCAVLAKEYSFAKEDQLAGGVTPDLTRLSIGIENIEDILWDLDRALQATMKNT